MTEIFENCLTAFPVFYRTYSRVKGDKRETWNNVCTRTTEGLTKLGKLTKQEAFLIYDQQAKCRAMTSGRYLWVGGTEWSEQPENFPGVYNCSSTAVDSWEAFSLIMDVTMMGCGAGAMLEPKYINQLPPIRNKINLSISRPIGERLKLFREEDTSVKCDGQTVTIHVGDSRQGWVDGYTALLETASEPVYGGEVNVEIDLSSVRPAGERLKGFGGISSPVLLPDTFINCAKVLNKAVGRQLNSLECCLLIDHAALAIVAGNIRRSAGIKMGAKEDDIFTTAKDNLWQQDEHGHWSIDPERDALRMSNHTRVFHKKPTREEVLHAVNKQYYSGEGAIQWVGESIARANCDLPIPKQVMIEAYENGTLEDLIRQSMPGMDDKEISHRLQRYGLNPCLTADNWVLTADGPRTVLDLVGEKFEAVIHGDTVPSDDRGFWLSGIKDVYKLQTEEGFSIRLTDNHKLLKANGEWVEVKDLQEGDQLLLHNHRGRFDEICFGWLAENLLKAEGLTLKSDMELPLFLTGNKERLEAIQRYLIWSGVFSTIELTEKKSSLVIRGESQEALRELITYYFHKDESALTKNNKPILATVKSLDYEGEEAVYDCAIPDYHYLDCNGFVTHNCGEIIMYNNFCNLGEVHLNLLDPKNEQEQYQAFAAAALSVAALLHHEFVPERYQYSREVDPIVGVSFTGLFDFFVNAFGVDWLKWWDAGRPDYYRLGTDTPGGVVVENANVYFKEQEQAYLNKWKVWVHDVIWEYCDRHGLRRPNRCTTVQPAGSKSLLTGASPGWHPPKSQRFIRRITFRKDDPVALACIDYGYNVIPSQSDKDENGKLLNDPYDPRCTEWLVEIPVEVNWANIPGADTIDISKLSVLAQFDFYMQVQKYYTSHNSSATLEFRENEIEPLADRIYQAIRDDEGYISAALLARFDDLQTFPRLPFEPISKEVYERMVIEMKTRQKTTNFHEALQKYDFGDMFEAGPAGCDSDKCLIGTIKK